MDDFVVRELPAWLEAHFPVVPGARGVTGHAMGGHGALVLGLRNPGHYRSISAFAPIVAPTQVPWGRKAFSALLGDDRAAWAAYDACELVRTSAGDDRLPLPVDLGDADGFLDGQLRPELLRAACDAVGHPLELRMQPEYDHGYYFVATFMPDHLAHHAKALR